MDRGLPRLHSTNPNGGMERISHTIALLNGETVQLRSFGRAHGLCVEVLGAADACGEPEVLLGSECVRGSHQGMDVTVTIQGHRVRVHSWGRQHAVRLTRGGAKSSNI